MISTWTGTISPRVEKLFSGDRIPSELTVSSVGPCSVTYMLPSGTLRCENGGLCRYGPLLLATAALRPVATKQLKHGKATEQAEFQTMSSAILVSSQQRVSKKLSVFLYFPQVVQLRTPPRSASAFCLRVLPPNGDSPPSYPTFRFGNAATVRDLSPFVPEEVKRRKKHSFQDWK